MAGYDVEQSSNSTVILFEKTGIESFPRFGSRRERVKINLETSLGVSWKKVHEEKMFSCFRASSGDSREYNQLATELFCLLCEDEKLRSAVGELLGVHVFVFTGGNDPNGKLRHAKIYIDRLREGARSSKLCKPKVDVWSFLFAKALADISKQN